MEIVLVEDEPVLRRTFHLILVAAGHRVRDAADGETGWRLCEDASPDLVITDVILPGMDGVELAKRVRKQFHDVGILLISAACGPEYVTEVAELGRIEFLRKPIDRGRLLACVEQWPK